MKRRFYPAITALFFLSFFATVPGATPSLLNASYDISRELYAEINPAFVAAWKKQHGSEVEIKQSHGGSSKQVSAILEGLPADVVTFNQVTDVETLANAGLVAKDWAKLFPSHSIPVHSFNGFLVRKGNPKNIRDWGDLAKPGVKVVFPNPKTSGNGRYTYLSAWAWAEKEFGGDRAKIEDYMSKVLANVPVFDTGGRGATNTFIDGGIGDVLITFEAETMGIRRQSGADNFIVVTPSVSIRADFPVAMVDRVIEKHGSRELAKAYLDFLYTPQCQAIFARNFYRVRDKNVAAEYASRFPRINLLTVEDVFGGWAKAQKNHIADGGTFDRLLAGLTAEKK